MNFESPLINYRCGNISDAQRGDCDVLVEKGGEVVYVFTDIGTKLSPIFRKALIAEAPETDERKNHKTRQTQSIRK